jgi:hypothetical protein
MNNTMNITLKNVDEDLCKYFCKKVMDAHVDFDEITTDMMEDMKHNVIEYYLFIQFNNKLMHIINLYGLNNAYKLSTDIYGFYNGTNITSHLVYVILDNFEDDSGITFKDITSNKLLLKNYMKMNYGMFK